jgi:hypothetical protein
MVQLAQAELRRKPPVNFIHVYMFGPTGGPLLPKPDHYNYVSWRQINEHYLRSRMEIGELIAVGANAVLRFRDAQGQITKRIIRGRDPLQIRIDGESFEIVHISSAEVGKFPEIYLRTSSTLSAEKGSDVLHGIERMLPDFHVSIYLRNDGLFIYEPKFPYLNPFQDEPTIPSEEEYRRTKTLECSWINACHF